MSKLLKKDKGFTLIEIVLVLAIAGLLLVIIFLAVSGAQRSRRDSQRKNDNARLMAQIEAYAGNNGGVYPTTAAALTPYIPTNFNDPTSGTAYNVTVGALAACGAFAAPAPITVSVAGRLVTSRICLEQGFQDLRND